MSQFEMKSKRTGRGFAIFEFTDRYGQKCSLQDSSLASEAAIWLGVDNTGPRITGPNEKFNEDVNARMHLTTEMVQELITHLQRFLDTGYVELEDEKAEKDDH